MFRNEKANSINMKLDERIESLVFLGSLMKKPSEEFKHIMEMATQDNPWFTNDNILNALNGISLWLHKDILEKWASTYIIPEKSLKRIGLILAGNIPMVGFHDILANYLVGNVSVIKFSEKDTLLIQFLLDEMLKEDPASQQYFDFDQNFKTIDALIATGSDQSADLFRKYFKNIPSLIRCHRNAVAILNGEETDIELLALGNDIFSFFGLGCRNISKLYVPNGYSFDHLLELFHDRFKEIVLHNKYKNNFDYQYAIYLLSKEVFLANGCLILKESDQLSSPVSCLFYEYYKDVAQLEADLHSKIDKIQVIASNIKFQDLKTVKLGMSQMPAIDDYADGEDTLEFLLNV